MSGPLLVLVVSAEYPPRVGGVGDYTARLCAALAPERVQAGVLTTGRSARPEMAEQPSNPCWVARAVPRWDFTAYAHVGAAVRAFRPHVVHVQYQAGAYQLHPAVNLLPLWLRARWWPARVGVTFHDLRPPYLFPKAGPLRGAIVRLMAATSDGVVCTDAADLRALGPGPGRRHIPLASNVDCATPPGYDQRVWRAARGLPADGPLVGFFGFMNRSKGVESLFGALARLPGVHLVLLGGESGPSDATDAAEAQRLRALEEALGLGDRVWRSGLLAPADLSAALLACDLIALPFADGASGRRGSLLAALAHGRAIVTTRGPSSGLLEPGRDAELVEAGDVEALAEAIRTLLSDPARRARLERGARERAQGYTWPTVAQAHEQWYWELVAGPPRARRR